MAKLRALIFDVDGTLADTEKYGHRVAFNRAFRASGLNWDWSADLYGTLLSIAGGKERILHYINNYDPDFQHPNLVEFSANLHQAKSRIYQQLLRESIIPLRPGVKRLLNEARSHQIRLAIATTSALPNVLALLENTLGAESINWFEVIAAGDMVSHKKPAPDVYLYVLEKMGLTAEECLVFEDSHQGLQAALQAKLPTIVTVNDYTQDHDFTGAKLVINNLGEPDQPFEIIRGHISHAHYLDIASLENIAAS